MTENEAIAQLDIEACRRIVVARAINWGRRKGRSPETYEALEAAGLATYLPPQFEGQRHLTIPADVITRALTDAPLVIAVDENDDHGDVADTFHGELLGHVAKWILANVQPDETNADKAVDVLTTILTWGPFDPNVWPRWHQETHEELRRIVLAILTWGDEKEICSELEAAIQAIGLEQFLPPKQVQLTVPLVPGSDPVTLTVGTDRLGNVDRESLGHAIQDALADLISDAVANHEATVTPVPVS